MDYARESRTFEPFSHPQEKVTMPELEPTHLMLGTGRSTEAIYVVTWLAWWVDGPLLSVACGLPELRADLFSRHASPLL